MHLKLIKHYQDSRSGVEQILFDGDFLLIGRTQGNLQLDDQHCSREHCVIYEAPNGLLMLRDLGSTNGTFHNGKRLVAEVEFKLKDEIRIGKILLTLSEYIKAGATGSSAGTQTQAPPNLELDLDPQTFTATGVVVHRWPENYSAMPKKKSGNFLEYVDSKGTRSQINISNIKPVRPKKKAG